MVIALLEIGSGFSAGSISVQKLMIDMNYQCQSKWGNQLDNLVLQYLVILMGCYAQSSKTRVGLAMNSSLLVLFFPILDQDNHIFRSK